MNTKQIFEEIMGTKLKPTLGESEVMIANHMFSIFGTHIICGPMIWITGIVIPGIDLADPKITPQEIKKKILEAITHCESKGCRGCIFGYSD